MNDDANMDYRTLLNALASDVALDGNLPRNVKREAHERIDALKKLLRPYGA